MNTDQNINEAASSDSSTGEFAENMKRYIIELDETYLFPKSEHDDLISQIATEYDMPLAKVQQDFHDRGPIGDWLQTFWARMIEPTRSNFDEITPIIARVRHGCSTPREFDWLGERIALAIQLDDHSFLKVAFKLATTPLIIKGAYTMSIAAFDYFDEKGEAPSYSQLKNYVEDARGDRALKYESISSDNWNRLQKRSGVRNILRSDRQ